MGVRQRLRTWHVWGCSLAKVVYDRQDGCHVYNDLRSVAADTCVMADGLALSPADGPTNFSIRDQASLLRIGYPPEPAFPPMRYAVVLGAERFHAPVHRYNV